MSSVKLPWASQFLVMPARSLTSCSQDWENISSNRSMISWSLGHHGTISRRQVLGEACTNGCVFSIKKFMVSEKVIVSSFQVDITNQEAGPQIKPNPAKLKALTDIPRPETLFEVRSFIGLLAQLSTFMLDFAHLAQNIKRMSSKN